MIPRLLGERLDSARKCLGIDESIVLCDPTFLCLEIENVFPTNVRAGSRE